MNETTNETNDEITNGVATIDDFDDPRLRPYRNLRERTLRGESIFIAEGPLVVERLARSNCAIESILTTRSPAEFGELWPLVAPNVPIYRVDEKAALEQIVGFDFYRGILAVGKRAPTPTVREGFARFFAEEASANEANAANEAPEKRGAANAARGESTVRNRSNGGGAWVVLPDATKPDNLGLAFRCAAALGARGVVLGERCCDPFSRRALRVSMGGVLQTPIYRAENLLDEIREVRERWNVRFFATVLDDDAVALPDVERWPARCAFVFGNEYSGMTPEQVAACDGKLTIPMRPDVDSLNLGVSVGVFLYEYNRGRRRGGEAEKPNGRSIQKRGKI